MIDSAKRVGSAGSFGRQTIRAARLGGLDQAGQKLIAGLRHIAGDDQIPFGASVQQGCVESSQRAAILHGVGQDRETKMSEFFHGTENRGRSGGAADPRGHGFDQRGAVHWQKGLVPAHAAACASGQNKPGDIAHQMAHEKMVAAPDAMVELNKKVYICFLLAFFMLAASPSRAAEVATGSSAPAPALRRTLVVRADPRTGKLVRSVIVSARPLPKTPSADVSAIVEKAAKTHSVDPLLVHSIIQVESNYNERAVSNKGAQGLMQLTPSTARMLGVSDSFDPRQNIEAGVKYLKYLKDLYKDDRLALAAYNAGPGAVDKYKQVPPYAETRNYVEQVGKRYGEARRAADAAKPAPVAQQVIETKPAEIQPAAVETFIDENGRPHLKTIQ